MGRSLASGECSEVRAALSGSLIEETLPQFPGPQRPGLSQDALLLLQDVEDLLCPRQSPLLPLFLVGQLLSLLYHCMCPRPEDLGEKKPWALG